MAFWRRLSFKILALLSLGCTVTVVLLSLYYSDLDVSGKQVPAMKKRNVQSQPISRIATPSLASKHVFSEGSKSTHLNKTAVPTTTLPPPIYNATAAMLERQAHIRNVCSTERYQKQFGAGRGHKLIVSEDTTTLMYCPIPKGGWSTWKRLFYREKGIEHLMADTRHGGFQSEWHKAGLKVVNPADVTQLTKHRLVFVRNPFDRLLSGYKYKVLSNGGKTIRKNTRFCTLYKYNKAPHPPLTFPQFVACILEKAQRTGWPGKSLDFHYRPQTLLCNFCDHDYNIIGHMEHMDDDIVAALKALNMSHTTAVRENSSGNPTLNSIPLAEWYRQLSEELMDGVLKVFARDFELFGYSLNISNYNKT